MLVTIHATCDTQEQFKQLLEGALAQMGEGTPVQGYPNAGCWRPEIGSPLVIHWHRH